MPEIAAKGTAFQIYDGVSAYATVAQVRDIAGPGLSVDTIDTTNHDSTGGWRTKLGGLRDGGDVSLDLLFDPVAVTHADGAGGLLNQLDAGTVELYKIIFTDAAATEWDFSGIVTGFSPAAPHDGALTASVTVTLTGQPTLV